MSSVRESNEATPRRFRGRFHLVLAVVGIGDQMPDVRDVDDERDLEALTLQEALQKVGQES